MLLDKLIIWLISPLGTSLVLALSALLFGWRRCHRAALAAGLLACAWLVLWSLPAVSLQLRSTLEADYPPVPVAKLPEASAIVVLGGGLRPPGRDGSVLDLQAGVDRVHEAARLYHAGRAPLVVLSGGSDKSISVMSEAAAMAGVLRELGVPESVLLLEERSRNTRENARFTADMLAERDIRDILLVTSALHMPRAKSLFEAQGMTVVAAATDHETRLQSGALDWLPDAMALDGSGRAMKELVARMTGR